MLLLLPPLVVEFAPEVLSPRMILIGLGVAVLFAPGVVVVLLSSRRFNGVGVTVERVLLSTMTLKSPEVVWNMAELL